MIFFHSWRLKLFFKNHPCFFLCHFVTQVCWVHLEDCPWHKSLLQVELLCYIKHCYQLSHGWDVGFLSFWFQCKSCCLRSTFQVGTDVWEFIMEKKSWRWCHEFDGSEMDLHQFFFVANIPLFFKRDFKNIPNYLAGFLNHRCSYESKKRLGANGKHQVFVGKKTLEEVLPKPPA